LFYIHIWDFSWAWHLVCHGLFSRHLSTTAFL